MGHCVYAAVCLGVAESVSLSQSTATYPSDLLPTSQEGMNLMYAFQCMSTSGLWIK